MKPACVQHHGGSFLRRRPVRARRALQIGCVTMAGVCACVAAAAFAPADPAVPVTEVCFEGRVVKFEGTPAGRFTRWFRYGPWQYGARGSESRPDDRSEERRGGKEGRSR